MTVTALMEIKIVTVWTFYYKTIIIVLHTPVTADSGWTSTGLDICYDLELIVESSLYCLLANSANFTTCEVLKTQIKNFHE